ncbi:MAG: type II secretion system GspH family protein [Sedimentisphaerales bacterium]|nr:type II secretion system GspH family protein [Sedimentisphaerales bacterium]
MKRALSLVELMIILAVIGILAAIIVPQFQESSSEAREAVAKDHLRILRSTIELYTARHSGAAPGYENDIAGTEPNSAYFIQQTVLSGKFFRTMPKNPFNNLDTINMIGDSEPFPPEASGNFGWVYQPASMTIRLDWRGEDKDGLRYFDY